MTRRRERRGLGVVGLNAACYGQEGVHGVAVLGEDVEQALLTVRQLCSVAQER